jgi:F-type H+-transporting ATPase subunit epsilon
VAKPLYVELVSVEAMVWSGDADMIVARTTEGELGVLAGHAPLLGQLKDPSRIRVKTGDDELAWDIAGGFLSVTNDGVTILAESARPAEGPDPAAVAALAGTSTTADTAH